MKKKEDSGIELLKKVIKESLRITVARIDPETGAPESDPLISRTVGEDAEDEIVWIVDKYSRPAIVKGTRERVPDSKTGKLVKKGARTYTDEVAGAIKDVIGQLEELTALHGTSKELAAFNSDALYDVIFPWEQEGFDVLRRILIATKRTKRPFPFFTGADAVRVGSTLKIPSAPDGAAVQLALDTKKRIGRNDTGKGELLFALLTGGIAGSEVGDLSIDGEFWEMKDTRGSSIRLGDLASDEFVDKLTAEYERAFAPGTPPVPVRELLRLLATKSWFDELGAVNPGLATLVDATARDVLTHGGALAGYVLVESAEFRLVGTEDFWFDTFSKGGRLHVYYSETPPARATAPVTSALPSPGKTAKK